MGGEDKIFKAKFTSNGIERLRNKVTEKLKEFMGDYTDDTLVEYVIVLLRNGRSKDEARNELNVFLGDDDSSSFVTWLWDHLSANLNLYVQSDDSGLNEEAKKKSVQRDLGASHGLQNPERGLEKDRVDPICDNGDRVIENKHTKCVAKTSHHRPEIGRTHFEDPNQHGAYRTKRSLSPRPSGHRKRNRFDDEHSERPAGSLTVINPSSRLLQSAVREAVGTAGVSNKTSEPNSKRLRSVVTTSSVDDNRRRLRSMPTVSSIAGVALKAAAEAAEDVLRARPTGNVFDRLGRGVDVVEEIDRTSDFIYIGPNEDSGFDDRVPLHPQFYQVFKDGRRYASELVDNETEFTIDIDQDGIDDADNMGYRNSSLSQTSTLIEMDDDTGTIRHGNPANSYRLKRKYQNQSSAVLLPSYDEYVNIPATANIWKPPPYMLKKEIPSASSSRIIQGSTETSRLRPLKENTNGVVGTASRVIQGSDSGDGTSGVQIQKNNINGVAGIGNGKSALFRKTELHKTPSTATGSVENPLSLEDADSRTIFVNNVHFAATKDSLSQHFNKYGQVLRVTILTDFATGQPKGSAYVEFIQKEAAMQATSLDGTSFISRIIKVCMKSSAQPEATTLTTMAWPRAVLRGSPYPVRRFSRASFPRGSPSSFRGRSIARPGARSLQWKRDAQPAPPTRDSASAPPGISAPPIRSLTYVRPELKAEGASN